ncbi:MAG: substrate-binding domain-containing protein [Cyclobacteriaceae bacterium]
MDPKIIRIKDIARLAGVSKGTVDRVLHGRGGVSDKSLQRVLKIMEKIDYKPNLIARTLGTHKNYRIIALIPDPVSDPYWEQTNLGVSQAQSEWAQYGITIVVYFFDQYSKESFKKQAYDAFLAKPDGILTAPIFYDEALPFFNLLKTQRIPYVLFNTNIPEVNPLSFIGQNIFHSGKVGAELMYRGQHAGGKLALLHLDEDFHNSIHLLEKERGFREFFKTKNKFSFEIKEFSLNPADESFEASLAELCDDGELKGIFVSTSKGTSVVASFLERNGKQDIMLIGYDLLEENLKYLRSGTIDFLINQNPKRQASLGISHLVNYLLFKKKAPDMDLFPLEVITQQNLESYLSSGLH